MTIIRLYQPCLRSQLLVFGSKNFKISRRCWLLALLFPEIPIQWEKQTEKMISECDLEKEEEVAGLHGRLRVEEEGKVGERSEGG